ncbi:MAG: hypothetical protein V1913_14575 [Fibrobacterota bacterium]
MNLSRPLTAALTLGALILMTGCAKTTKPDTFDYKDGNAGFAASEVNNMDNTSLTFGAGAPKEFVAEAETLYIERSVTAWHYDAAAQGFVREANVTFPQGERNRKDTVLFYDASGNLLSSPTLATVDSVVHKRVTIRTRAGNEVIMRLHMATKILKTASDTTAVKNGNIRGTFNGYELDSNTATVTNVTRSRVDGHWGFPVSGSIYIDRILRTIETVFTGGNSATTTITRKRDNKTWIILVNLDTAEENDK